MTEAQIALLFLLGLSIVILTIDIVVTEMDGFDL